MLSIRSFAVLTALGAGMLYMVYSIGRVACLREANKRDADDLARWESEGGPPPPDECDLTKSSTA